MIRGIYTPKARLLTVLLGGSVDRIPVTSIAGCSGTVNVEMQDYAGIYWPEAHKDPEKMAKLAIVSYMMSGLECVRVPFDMVVEAEAFGCKIKWFEARDSVPMVASHPYNISSKLNIPNDILSRGRIPTILNAIRFLRRKVGSFLPISSSALGPFTLAGELTGIERLLIQCVKNLRQVIEFINGIEEFIIDYCRSQYRAGSDIIVIVEPSASSDLISPKMFRDIVKPSLIRIASELKGFKILHICGNTSLIIKDMAECGYHGVSISNSVNIRMAKILMGKTKLLGGISTKTLLLGSPENIREAVREAINAGIDIVEPECGIPPNTPLINIKSLVEETVSYSNIRGPPLIL